MMNSGLWRPDKATFHIKSSNMHPFTVLTVVGTEGFKEIPRTLK